VHGDLEVREVDARVQERLDEARVGSRRIVQAASCPGCAVNFTRTTRALSSAMMPADFSSASIAGPISGSAARPFPTCLTIFLTF
jgi:hypothetical protein